MAFVERKIDVTISLGQGNFGNSGFDTVKVQNLRVSCQVERLGLPGQDLAHVKIYGLSLSLMNQLSTLGTPPLYQRNNRILIEAGDAIAGMSTAFNGTIGEVEACLDDQPTAYLDVACFNNLLPALKPAESTSYQGNADAADIISGLAQRMGLGFENNGVSVQLSAPYFSGSLRNQLLACAAAANVYAYIDDVKHVVAIWPAKGQRDLPNPPVISVETGMVGYPRGSDTTIKLRTIFNPTIVFNGPVQVKSTITTANKTWIVNQITHNLESQVKGGAWFTDIEGFLIGENRLSAPMKLA